MRQGSSATATLTDEQILGLEPMPENGANANGQAANEGSVVAQVFGAPSAPGPEAFPADGGDENPRVPRPAQKTDAPGRPELQNPTAPAGDPAWLAALEAQPQGGREAAAEARAWRSAATDIAGLDAAYFSDTPGARAGLAARLYDSDPGAFRAMLAESARVIAERDPAALAALAQQLGAGRGTLSATFPPAWGAVGAPQPGAPGAIAAPGISRTLSGDAAPTPQGPGFVDSPAHAAPGAGRPELQNQNVFPADAYRSFETSTNDAVGRRVHQQIDRTLGSTLPEGTPEGARRRIAEDIFEEVHASLAADRDLARRVGETLRDWRFDAAARAQVTDLLSGRARAVLPEVARRVVAEWTSSVLASDRAKSARIATAAARHDITGGRLPEPVPASALRPRGVDYRRLTDEQILDL